MDAGRVLERLDALALCTDLRGEITRLFLTPAHRQAITLLSTWMEQAGLAPKLDASGTLVGRLHGRIAGGPTLMLGSHIDSVRNAGRYDGCLGVVMAIELAAGIGAHTLPYDLEIRAFGDEEGVRFPVTLTGAHAAAGSFSPSWLSATDSGGTTLDEALQDFDLDPTQLLAGTCTARCFAYLEIHIEQGPVLESLGAPLGIVTAINGAERHEITLTGRAGHAGTVPMDQRQDALVAAAHMVLAIERIARAQAGVVATVGRLGVSPDAPNVIPGRCVFTIDLRASDDAARARAAADILAELDRLAATYHVSLRRHRTHAAPAVACDPRLQACLANALRVQNLPVIHLPSGAGHDAMVMADICPIGMMFVRCPGGISHHPDEAVIANDVALACQVMRHALLELDPHRL